MNPIRPNFPLVTTPRPVRPEARAAQRAFFEANIGRATAAAAPAAEAIKPTAPGGRALAGADQPPQRYLRPGSLLDIKV